MSGKSQDEYTASAIAKIATFIRGLNLFQMAHLCLLGSSFAMRRFGYGGEAVSIFVPLTLNAMDLLYTYAILSTTLIVTILRYSAEAYFYYVTSGMSMASALFTMTVNALLLKVYAFDDSVDSITRYYWFMLMGQFAAGMDATCITTIAADSMSPFGFGISLAGIVVAVLHWVVIKILDHCDLDIDYWLIVSQLALILSLSIASAIAWFAYIIKDKIASSPEYAVGDSGGSSSSTSVNSMLGYVKTLPMVLASSIGLGVVWAIFPYISPFELVEFQYQYPIQRMCVVFEALSGISLLLVDDLGKCLQKDWYVYPYALWHMVWLLFIPYLGIAVLFLRCMHYPESLISRAVLRRPRVVGALTVLYYTISRLIYGFGHTAIKANAMGHGEVISPMSVGIDFISLNVLKYMSAAYVQQFHIAKEGLEAGKAWPTDGMSKSSAVRYWVRIAARVGYANFKQFSTADVKKRLAEGFAGHTVNYRRPSSFV